MIFFFHMLVLLPKKMNYANLRLTDFLKILLLIATYVSQNLEQSSFFWFNRMFFLIIYIPTFFRVVFFSEKIYYKWKKMPMIYKIIPAPDLHYWDSLSAIDIINEIGILFFVERVGFRICGKRIVLILIFLWFYYYKRVSGRRYEFFFLVL